MLLKLLHRVLRRVFETGKLICKGGYPSSERAAQATAEPNDTGHIM
jgi:hypothetical protein